MFDYAEHPNQAAADNSAEDADGSVIDDHPPKVLFQIDDSQQTEKGQRTRGRQREAKLHSKYQANWEHLQAGGLIKTGQKVADMADKGAGVGSEVRANEKDG